MSAVAPVPRHFHLTSASLDDQRQTVARSLRLGARHIDIGQRPEVSWGGETMAPMSGKIRLRFDLAPPVGGDQQEEADRLISLGATRNDIGRSEVDWVSMADPDGREFRVLIPR